jgi:cell division protein FtsL
MNAAGRLVHQGILTRHRTWVHVLTYRQLTLILLALAVLFSALGVIYMTEETRDLQATYQQHLREQDHLHLERGQLLLERSTWMMQARIQQIAENQLGMIIPNHKSVVIVHE